MHERARPHDRTDAGKPTLRRKDPRGRIVPLAGGAPGSGAPQGNQNARRHGLFTGEAIAERKQIGALLGEARRLLRGMK